MSYSLFRIYVCHLSNKMNFSSNEITYNILEPKDKEMVLIISNDPEQVKKIGIELSDKVAEKFVSSGIPIGMTFSALHTFEWNIIRYRIFIENELIGVFQVMKGEKENSMRLAPVIKPSLIVSHYGKVMTGMIDHLFKHSIYTVILGTVKSDDTIVTNELIKLGLSHNSNINFVPDVQYDVSLLTYEISQKDWKQ